MSFIICSLASRRQVGWDRCTQQKSLLIPGIVKARTRPPSVTSSPHLKRQEHVETVASTLDRVETRDSAFREMCLQRDSHCCVVTGHIDINHWKKVLGSPDDVDFTPVDAAHIIPFAYTSWKTSSVICP